MYVHTYMHTYIHYIHTYIHACPADGGRRAEGEGLEGLRVEGRKAAVLGGILA